MNHIAQHPRDVLAVSAAVPTIAFSGVTDIQQEAWELVEGLAPAYGDHWWYISLLAFTRQDQSRFDDAGLLAESALSCEPTSGHAVHAQTHVLYETGQHDAGRAWLDHWVAESGRAASHRAHFSWHAALHELALGDTEAVRQRYYTQLAPPDRDRRARADRLRVAALALGGDHVRTGTPPQAPRPSPARPRRRRSSACSTRSDPTWSTVRRRRSSPCTRRWRSRPPATCRGWPPCVPTARAAPGADGPHHRRHRCARRCWRPANSDWGEAARVLADVLPGLPRVGGSAAQREIVEETLLFCLVSDGQAERALALLDGRLDRRTSPLDRRRRDSLATPSGAYADRP